MTGIMLLAWRALGRDILASLLQVAAIALVIALPVSLRAVVKAHREALQERARSTPLVVGAPGSRLELVLHALHFRGDATPGLTMAAVSRASRAGLAIPLHVARRAEGAPLVATTPEYLAFRGLRVASGTPPLRLGDCVVGATLARARGWRVGDAIAIEAGGPFDVLAGGAVPLRIAGMLEPSGTTDDEAVICGLATAWLADGIGHAHEAPSADDGTLLSRDADGGAVASAALRPRTTPGQDIHFHVDRAALPVTAVLVQPRDDRAAALLRAEALGPASSMQVVVPSEEVDALLGVVARVQGLLHAQGLVLSVAALLLIALVTLLRLRLRAREFAILAEIGCARGTAGLLVGCEIVLLLLGGAALAVPVATAASGALGERLWTMVMEGAA